MSCFGALEPPPLSILDCRLTDGRQRTLNLKSSIENRKSHDSIIPPFQYSFDPLLRHPLKTLEAPSQGSPKAGPRDPDSLLQRLFDVLSVNLQLLLKGIQFMVFVFPSSHQLIKFFPHHVIFIQKGEAFFFVLEKVVT